MFKRFIPILAALAAFAVMATTLHAQELETSGSRIKLPKAYKLKVVRDGEQRTSEFFYTAEFSGSGSVTTLADTKASHAGRYIGAIAHCLAIDSVVCQVPALSKNGTPITDALVLAGGEHQLIPFSEIVPVDTSDTIDITGSCITTGTSGTEPARCMFQLITPRNWQAVAGDH